MNNYEVKFLPAARIDMKEIFRYIKEEDPTAAIHRIEILETEISKLSTFPLMGTQPKQRKLRTHQYRMLIVSNYIVFYIFENEMVKMHRVIHAKRR